MQVRTVEALTGALHTGHSDQRTYTFIKEDATWYVDLPAFLARGGDKEDLRLRAGTNRLLKMLAGKSRKITLVIDTEPFEGAGVLDLVAHCEAPRGGAIYRKDTGNTGSAGVLIWICDIALFVFGDMPERIYFKKSGTAGTSAAEVSRQQLLSLK